MGKHKKPTTATHRWGGIIWIASKFGNITENTSRMV